MTKIMPTKFPNGKCRRCLIPIAFGAQVAWTKGEKGVLCMPCHAETTPAPAPRGRIVNTVTGETVEPETAYQAVTRQLAAALSDGQALRKRIGELEHERNTLRTQNLDLVITNNNLRAFQGLAVTTPEDLVQVAAERDAAGYADPADLIDVMAPGGVEAWLQHDLAQTAAKRQAEQADLDATNYGYGPDDSDCPI